MSNFSKIMRDGLGRRATYLRLSVTDRCNLRCFYCVSRERQNYIPHSQILRYEEFYRLIAIARKQGIKKVRITGGEPFARRDLMDFLFSLRSRFGDLRLALTTNATLLDPFINDLARLSLDSINVSLDSFDRASFRKITGADNLEKVIANVQALLGLGVRVKINAVALAGITDSQIGEFLHFARENPVDLRFIEYMPMGSNTLWDESIFIACSQLQKLVPANLKPVACSDASAGPARMFEIEGARGRLGFISAVSDHFCGACNRLRITSDGRLRSCLFADSELRLAPLLRHKRIDDERIGRVLAAGFARKPIGADLLAAKSRPAVAARQMVGIGG